jgi:protein TonB
MKKSILIGFAFCALGNAAFAQDAIHEIVYETIDNGTTIVYDTIDKVFDIVDEMPQFISGTQGLYQFISQNIKYPVEAVTNGIQGRVILQFVVQKDGSIANIEVVSSPAASLSEEAVRVLKLLPNWIPGMQKGIPVNVHYSLPFIFKFQ